MQLYTTSKESFKTAFTPQTSTGSVLLIRFPLFFQSGTSHIFLCQKKLSMDLKELAHLKIMLIIAHPHVIPNIQYMTNFCRFLSIQ